MITWDQVMLVQRAAQFFVLVALKLFRLINVFNILIIILKFSIKKQVRPLLLSLYESY